MAILSKIRDRSMFLILIVGLALFAFVLNPSSIQRFFNASKTNEVGEVNGQVIGREDFAKQVENYRAKYGSRVTQMQAVNTVWNSLVSEKIFKTQLKEAGIVVGEKDIWDAMVAMPEIQNSPIFKNKAGLFDEEKLKEYVATLEDDAKSGNTKGWIDWLNTEKQIKQNLERQAYTTLVSAGLGASLKEGERDYNFNNETVSGNFVFMPYRLIPDSLVVVTKGDILNYVKDNPKTYKPEATRSIKYIKFDIVPSKADGEAVKAKVASYINDKEEYSNAAKSIIKTHGLKNATNYEEFLVENKSDLLLDNSYKFKNQVPKEISEAVFNGKLGDVFGPYKENGFYKISKLVEVIKMPDSVKSSHIIVPYKGAVRSTSNRTKEAAKKMADSIYNLVKNSDTKFKEMADKVNSDGTKGKGGSIGWITKNQAFSPSFDKDFANFIFKNKTGSIKVVETAFGFHVIKINEQTKPKKAVKLVTFARSIEPSEDTENLIFQKAEMVASQLSDGKKIDEVAKADGYKVQSAVNLKVLSENVPGIGAQRQIVTWSYKPEREIGNSKRFDINVGEKRGYAVVVLTGMTSADEISLNSSIIAKVRPLLISKKKAALLKEKIKGTTLAEIAKNANTTVRFASSVSLASPLISGVGNEPSVVGAMSTLALNKVSPAISGNKGVFVVQVTKRKNPIKLNNYNAFRNNMTKKLQGRSYQLYQVLQDNADITDNRGKFF
ncbi:SurA N-terminal domain-containing protein [Lutibacter sp.]|uniref:peptidylprolyl isomerase n=1 Tax=Lutibacter sp. TaxID=1925666 RepID=UPI0025BE64AC|nr:SurA N-terminal domain-containing protein [Lutibacter sp.]MCF6181042.1 SurA N-terminal domain-containing protein [Lutibacter sp.]